MGQFDQRFHPDTAELIDYLDGVADQETVRHLQQCADCRTETERLDETRTALSALPVLSPPEQAWAGILQRVDKHQGTAAGSWWQARWLAVAATLFLVLGISVQLAVPPPTGDSLPIDGELVAETRSLESMLSYLDGREKPMNLSAAGRIARIEDSIGVIDQVITRQSVLEREPAVRKTLLEERVNLLKNLVAARAQPMLTSYRAY